MAGSVNKVILVGNLGFAPELRAMQNGNQVATLRVATSESWKDKQTGERKEKTEWHRVVVFNENLVRLLDQYAQKGSKLYIEGHLQTRKWTNAEGNDQYATEVVVQGYGGTIKLLDARKGEKGDAHEDATSARTVDAELDDEIPF